ncbi:MAG: hypothetical protein OXE92_04680 [Bacteroidetes bacterium]|nr:hypothetical protein [Bacteroidota bacterium]MCY4205005.1 hypothetical protein [Bacteroidota bacterium]
MNTRYLLGATFMVIALIPAQNSFSQQEMVFDDPRVGLAAGLFDAEEAIWNLTKLTTVRPPEDFIGATNTDLAFKDHYVFQGNYNGIQIWDVSDPANPVLAKEYLCPASQSDVSVYENLLFVSGEGLGGRLDCGTQGVDEQISEDRLRGIRIFDITDVLDPQYIHNVQTCRGSHTHSLLKDPEDDENIYVYVAGSAPVRPAEELPGCSGLSPSEDPESSLFRIEVIKVPLANPVEAAIMSSPRIFEDLAAPPVHGPTEAEKIEFEEARARGEFVVSIGPRNYTLPDRYVAPMIANYFSQQEITEPTSSDTAAFREALPEIMSAMMGANNDEDRGPDQCHDITLYPEIGLAGGACEGYGLLLDISDPLNPVRIDAVADSNFAYWHSATFSNDGSKILFTDEWGGGRGAKCRETDPMEWGANAYFTIDENNQMTFVGYYKLPVPQTKTENCVAHNGSLIPIPGRDIFVQSWYQGGISITDWTDPTNVIEIAYHDRGPVSDEESAMGGSWSVYWYNGYIYNSEIARGLDVFELTPSEFLTENEIAAANTVQMEYLNAQKQPTYVWPPSFALARAHVDQMERNQRATAEEIASLRAEINEAEQQEDLSIVDRIEELIRSQN